MAIKIQTEKPVIPIEIGNLTFEFEITDENVKRFHLTQDEIKKEFEQIKGDDYEKARETIKKAFDYILGDGAFEKIYELSPSIIVVSKYLNAVAEGLKEEIPKRTGITQQQKAQKYIRNKKKK